MWRNLGVVLLALPLILNSACTGYRHNQWHDQVPDDSTEFSLRYIEADDEGWFWDPAQANSAMTLIRDKVAERDTIVVIFVHGWHHSAECCDGNVEGFRKVLSKLHALKPDLNFVGVYIGWRGKSLPMPLDYLTFWGRKSASERVGENDLREFIARLQYVYLEFRPDARRPTPGGSPRPISDEGHNFLGLVTIGHSFGAQVVLKSVTSSLEDQLQRINPNPAYLRNAQLSVPDLDHPSTITGVGDLIVLINPAVEASQYQRLHILSRGLAYSDLQTPLILTVSSENDKARHKLFTLGRVFGEFFTGKPRKEDKVERTVERQALGVYPGHVSHQLMPTVGNVKLIATSVIGDAGHCKARNACEVDWRAWESDPLPTKPNSLTPGDPKLRSFDFSGEVVFNNVELSPLTAQALIDMKEDPKAYAVAQPYQPLIVARASRNVIDDHSGIFTDPFLRFLVPYIAYIEEKSKLYIDAKRLRREDEATRSSNQTSKTF